MTTSRVITSHTKKYELTHFARLLVSFGFMIRKDLERWSGSGLYGRGIDT